MRNRTDGGEGWSGLSAESKLKQRLAISKTKLGVKMPPSFGEKIRKAKLGTTQSEETKLKRRLTLTGQKRGPASAERKQKIREKMLGREAPNKGKPMPAHQKILFEQEVECPHCGKTGQIGPIHRWHFDRCKFRA